MATEIRDQPRSSDVARDEIERTRARMSETIDEIEGALLRKRDDLRERLDFPARLREKPVQAVAIALGAGLLLGLLTAGEDRAERSRREDEERRLRDDERAELAERRAEQLLALGQEQERRLERLESAVSELARRRRDADGDDGIGARLAELRAGVADRIEEAATATAKRFRESVLRDR